MRPSYDEPSDYLCYLGLVLMSCALAGAHCSAALTGQLPKAGGARRVQLHLQCSPCGREGRQTTAMCTCLLTFVSLCKACACVEGLPSSLRGEDRGPGGTMCTWLSFLDLALTPHAQAGALRSAALTSQLPKASGARRVEVEAVPKDLEALTSEARMAAVLADSPELLALLQDLQESLAEVC